MICKSDNGVIVDYLHADGSLFTMKSAVVLPGIHRR